MVSDDAQRLRDITRRIGELKGRAALVLYELGTLLVEVEERALWRCGESSSFSDYLLQALDVSAATARKAMTVARHFNAGMVERYGIEKLSAGLRYMELSRPGEQPGDLVAARLRLRGADGRFQTVGFHEASSHEVREAVRVLREGRAGGVPGEEQARIARLGRALSELGAGSVRVKRRGGGLVVSFRDVPVEQLTALGALLQREE